MIDPIRIALPSKGHLCDGALDLLKNAGYRVRRASDRQYEALIGGHPRFHVVFMRPTDIVDQVQVGRCHLGVTGMDVYAEHVDESGSSVVVDPNLGYGGCRLVVAVPESWVDVDHMLDLVELTHDFREQGRMFRVSTKYAKLVRAYFRKWGIYHYQLIASDGALELHPTMGIADIIVDLTSSGTTLKDNRLREIESGIVLDSAACLIGHRESLRSLVAESDRGPLTLLIDALDGLRASEGGLHLEVVGTATGDGDAQTTAARVAECLSAHGAQHVFRGAVWDSTGVPGWRVTALITNRNFVQCERQLFALGASRAVGLPARFLFDRTSVPTFDRLVETLRETTP